MSAEKQHFTIRASASRLEKGLLAIPQRFKEWFPSREGKIEVFFDDADTLRELSFHPYDSTIKEGRIFGLGRWFSERNVHEGDSITITVEDPRRPLYRIVLDRFLQQRQEQQARRDLHRAATDSVAEQELGRLSRLARRRPRDLAGEELSRIALQSQCEPRPRVPPGAAERHEGVPAGIRILLREVHDGRCQLCSFAFEKRNGEPYFEVHHLDPEIGHHPKNLLVVCPNCHAQFEHAAVTDFTWAEGWLVGATINGRRVAIRQPLAHSPVRRAVLGLIITVAAAQIGRRFVR
ncbi:MAG: hypothetical protein ACRD2B_16970 [Terriglobia bacterium]